MNDSNSIPEEKVLEIFALAARFHEENERDYSLSELQQIATEAGISSECIERAVREVQSRQTPKDDCQEISKPQVLWLKGIYATTLGLLLFLWLAPILWDISHTFYLTISQEIEPDVNSARSQRENLELKKASILDKSEREEIERLKAEIVTLHKQIKVAERSYHTYIASLPRTSSRWSQSQKVENNRLVANLNGLQAEQDRLLDRLREELRQQVVASPQAITSEIEILINKLD